MLSENLFRLRDLIDQYYVDKGQYPPSLETLVEDGYLRKLPRTRSPGSATGRRSSPSPTRTGRTEQPGVYDVKSASELVSLAGTPYNEW